MASLYLSIGSNIEPEAHFQQCATALQQAFSYTVWSPVYRSTAVGMDADDFLNAVVSAQTNLSIELTVEQLKKIEIEHGRVRSENKFSSRTLDVDLLLYNEVVLDTEFITLPRPELTTEAYVLKPLADLIPNGVHPILNKTYDTLLSNLEQIQPECLSDLTTVSLQLNN